MKLAKVIQALGIAAVMLGLVQGLHGDAWGELYLFLAGIVVFYVGWLFERRRRKSSEQPPPTS